MNDVESLLLQDREAGVPEPPDVRYTAAAVRRRLLESTGPAIAAHPLQRSAASASRADRLLLIATAGGTVIGISAVLTLGLSPWWLLAIPFSALPLSPILLRKGAR